MNPWLLAARPKTLAAAVVPVLMGTALARRSSDRVQWLLFFCALAGSVLIQIGTNYVNDALDFKKGTDTGERIGPLRVTQAGLLGAAAVMRGALVCFLLAAACGIPLVLRGGWPLLAIGLLSIAAAYLYTGGPYPLAYHGLGELFVLIFFGLVAVGGSYYLQTLTLDSVSLIAGLAAGLLACVLIAINNLRDIDGDRTSRKRTVAVRIGSGGARIEIVLLTVAPFLAMSAMAWITAAAWPLLTWLSLPLALLLVRRVSRSDGAELNRCLAMAGALQWSFGLLFVAGSAL